MKNKSEEQYLAEDKDLLNEVESIGPASTGTGATTQLNKLIGIQIKAALRNRKTANDLDKTTKKYSFALIAFAIAQLVLGIFQFLFDAEFSGHEWIGLIYVVLAIVLIVYIIVTATKDISQN